MKQYLFLTSALVVSGLLSGVAEAACIQTPSCSSLGYTSSSSCTGGVKCPFGNAWNCTGPNNTTKINSINSSITNILNRITKLENNSGSGSGSGTGSGAGTGGYSQACNGCQVGDLYNGSSCYSFSLVTENGGYFVYAKENGKCKAMSLREVKRMTLEFVNSQVYDTFRAGQLICTALNNNTHLYGYFTAPYYDPFVVEEHPDGNVYVAIPRMYRSCKREDMNETYYGNRAGLEQFLSQFYMPKMITF